MRQGSAALLSAHKRRQKAGQETPDGLAVIIALFLLSSMNMQHPHPYVAPEEAR